MPPRASTFLATCLPLALLCACAGTRAPSAGPADYVYIGTYTHGAADRGIQAWKFDPGAGSAAALGLAAAVVDPSFIEVLPGGRTLLAVNETSTFGGGKDSGSVSAFAIEPATARLTLLNQVASRGAGPAYVGVDRSGTLAMVANYGSGSVALFPIGADGRLGASTGFAQDTGSSVAPNQAGPHAHAIVAAPDNRFALVADLGADALVSYRLDAAAGTLDPGSSPVLRAAAGSGPRHLAFSPDGRFVHVLDEITSTVTTYSYAASTGVLARLQSVSTLPAGTSTPNTGAEIALHPNGRFLYASNRGHDSVAVFAIDAATGLPTLRENVPTQGRTPRSFALDPSGAWLFVANQDSNNVVVFKVDPATGHPAATGTILQVDAPACVKVVPVPGGG
jgi:6-phosphogluconolactonase